MASIDTLFHFSFAVDDLDRARRFYGELLGCPEGRKLPGRADFNFFGHHIVAHLSPDDIVGDKGSKLREGGGTPMRHFGVVMPLDPESGTMQSPQELTGQLDELLDGVESIKQTAADTKRLLNPLGLKDLNI